MKLKKLFLLILFIGCSMLLFGQQKTLLDSSFQYLSDKYYEFKEVDSLKATFYADEFYKKALKEKDTIEMISAYLYKSQLLQNDSIYINFLDKFISITNKNPNKLYPAIFYQKKWKHFFLRAKNPKQALKEIIHAEKYAKITSNDSLEHLLKIKIGMMVSRSGDDRKSLDIYINSYKYYVENRDKIGSYDYFSLLYNISLKYEVISNLDSSLYFTSKAHDLSRKLKDETLVSYSELRLGKIKFKKGKYLEAIKNLESSIKGVTNDHNYPILVEIYSNIGVAYQKLNNINKSFIYHKKVDSIFDKKKKYYYGSGQRMSFKYLHGYYKQKKNLRKQLYFLNKIVTWDSIRIVTTNKLKSDFYKDYDKPKLIAEREQIIKLIQAKSNKTKYSLLGISGIILFLFGYQYRRRKQLKRRFEEVLKSNGNREARNKKQEKRQVELNIPNEVIEKVLKGLESFEAKHQFCDTKLNLQSLANDLETNANYLSKIINHYKELSFSQYLNELRINHVITLLDNNTTLRKYSIKAIAEEVGYKNAESFSNAFYKKTGLKPSYYIKQLEKVKV